MVASVLMSYLLFVWGHYDTWDQGMFAASLVQCSITIRDMTSIFISEESVSLLVCYSVTASPAQTVMPVTLIFGTIVGHHITLLLF